MSGLIAGGYKLQFYVDGLEQWSAQKSSFQQADVVTVVGGQTTTVEEAIAPYGTISGHVSNTDGTPAMNAQVFATDASGASGGFATTDVSGFYVINYLAAGRYRVSFSRDWNSPTQYANNATRFLDAAWIPVAVGTTTTLDQTFLPFATVTGTITDGGAPAAGVQLTFRRTGTFDSFSTSTDGTGTYHVSVWPGTYTVALNRNGLTQYVPGQVSEAQAQQYAFLAGPNILDEQLIPTGIISGRLTRADGFDEPFASVSASGANGTVFASTDFQGRYTLRAYPGQYTVAFRTSYGTQWENGRSSATQADPVTVVANASVTVDEVLAPFGSVTITAVDSVTGAPVNEFCAQADFGFTCTTNGTVTDTDALPGHYTVTGRPQDGVHLPADGAVNVVSGGSASLVLSLAPGGAVAAMMTDRESGAPVENACLELVHVTDPTFLGTTSLCSDASGAVQVSPLQPGTYKAFVWARDGVHGHLWVGQGGGGVGQFDKARTITVGAGQSVALGTVMLDKAGTLSGTVTDEATGAPVTGGVVALSSFDYGIGGQESMFPVDSLGHYTVANLGPYQWTLYFWANGLAAEWMGDDVNRDKAAHVKIKRGQVTTYDTELGAGTTVTGHVFGPDGTTLASFARLEFVNADTADNMGVADFFPPVGPTYTAQVKGVQRVKISYAGSANGQNYMGWVGGTGFADATVFTIPDGGEFVLDVTLTSPQE